MFCLIIWRYAYLLIRLSLIEAENIPYWPFMFLIICMFKEDGECEICQKNIPGKSGFFVSVSMRWCLWWSPWVCFLKPHWCQSHSLPLTGHPWPRGPAHVDFHPFLLFVRHCPIWEQPSHIHYCDKTQPPWTHVPLPLRAGWGRLCPLHMRSTSGLGHFLVLCWEHLLESLHHTVLHYTQHFHVWVRDLAGVAFDCYIAICFYPLRYTTILTHTLIGQIGVTIFLRSYCMIFPMIFLLKRLTFCQSNIIPDTCCEHIGLAKYACNDIRVNIWYGLSVIMSTVVLDVLLIFVSYTLILHAVFHVPSQDACHKALNTCGSHVCIIILFYGPAIITTITQQFGSQIPPHIHILLDNVCILAPPMLNPITYGIKIEQIREQVAHIFFPMQK